MSTASFPPTPPSQVRTVLQALQSVLDLAADAQTVTLPTPYVRTWRDELQGVLAQLDTTAPLTKDGSRGWRWLLFLGGIIAVLLLGLCLLLH